jgi:glucose-1-phosphate adenylyltransferase
MLDAHKKNDADVTIASIPELFPETCDCEVVNADENGEIFAFRKKPGIAERVLVSMGVYIFKWDVLREYLGADVFRRQDSDFGRDVIPAMFLDGKRLYAYRFEGYWRDADTIEGLWKSNMDLLRDPSEFFLRKENGEILGAFDAGSCRFVEESAMVKRSLLYGLHAIQGRVESSVLSDSVVVEKGAEVIDSILMPNVYIGKDAKIYKAVVASNSRLMEGVEIGVENGSSDFVSDRFRSSGISLIDPWVHITAGIKLQKSSHVESDMFVSGDSYSHSGIFDCEEV